MWEACGHARTAAEHEALMAKKMMSTPTCETSIVLNATIFTFFKATTKVAAFGRHHTVFVVAFVEALNRVNIVAVTTILGLHVGVVGHHVPRHCCFMPPRRAGKRPQGPPNHGEEISSPRGATLRTSVRGLRP